MSEKCAITPRDGLCEAGVNHSNERRVDSRRQGCGGGTGSQLKKGTRLPGTSTGPTKAGGSKAVVGKKREKNRQDGTKIHQGRGGEERKKSTNHSSPSWGKGR